MDLRRIRSVGNDTRIAYGCSTQFRFRGFVFAADDLVESRNQLLTAPRDNVIYEAGMFAGHLAFNRCFVAVPQDVNVKVPSDLHGINLGTYEQRRDGNLQAAVNVFFRR
jgi:predicted nucleotide-binding protein